ncbi:hypothetical protein GPECTOR_98g781 [Gonium pectorale]|uniref:Uncharacterized protein n=1 Tax=Gonium pectorale TaxID=33097 RepID=A0A150G031_GONPE|nr:hypothetical protein GPECTOR_98g781 [Gonium pectorale]|eukprot:KXZ43197.1 hypothetical protein GPECTOR_98g781 [Gonium pectorale]
MQAGRRCVRCDVTQEALALVEVVVGVARLMPPAAQRAVSDAVWELMHQDEPPVTHAGLVRALLAAYVTLRGSEELAALKAVAAHIQEVVGASGQDTQIE